MFVLILAGLSVKWWMTISYRWLEKDKTAWPVLLKYVLPFKCHYIWWLICAMSYYCVFGAKRRKGATRKPVKWWPFRVFAWRPFALPHESTTLFMRRLFASCLSNLNTSQQAHQRWINVESTLSINVEIGLK